jgi:hypothetical protein
MTRVRVVHNTKRVVVNCKYLLQVGNNTSSVLPALFFVSVSNLPTTERTIDRRRIAQKSKPNSDTQAVDLAKTKIGNNKREEPYFQVILTRNTRTRQEIPPLARTRDTHTHTAIQRAEFHPSIPLSSRKIKTNPNLQQP